MFWLLSVSTRLGGRDEESGIKSGVETYKVWDCPTIRDGSGVTSLPGIPFPLSLTLQFIVRLDEVKGGGLRVFLTMCPQV